MSEEEKRRCCILGGCGCGPEQQLGALAETIQAARPKLTTEDCYAAAKATFDVFGYGPFKARLHELGLDKGDGRG